MYVRQIISFVIVTVVVLTAISFLGAFAPESDSGLVSGWQFDDYVESGEVSSVEGSLELVEFAGTEYIHARSLGAGTITYTDGHIETVNVHKASLEVVLIWGQSNAANYVINRYEAPTPHPGTAYYFGNGSVYATQNTSAADYSQWGWQDMLNSSGVCKVGDKAPALCKALNEMTGHKVYIVDGAIGNRAISTFFPGQELWEYCKGILSAAIDAIDTDNYDYRVRYYCWIQGESDQYISTSTTYQRMFTHLFDHMSSGEIGYKFEDVFVSLLESRYTVANTAFENLASEYGNIHIGASAKGFTTGNGMLWTDGIHYTQAGDNIIGEELGRSIASEMTHGGDGSRFDATLNLIISVICILFVIGLVMIVGKWVVTRY